MWIFVPLVLVQVSCVGPAPIREYNFAHTAIEAAKKAGAEQYAPRYWNQAQSTYRTALKNYDDRQYEKAQELFLKAQSLAERAENQASITKFKSGEAF